MSNELTSLFTRIGIFAVLIAIFFWLYQDPQRDETGAIVQAGNIDPLELFAGDCYKEEFEVLEAGEFTDQSSVVAVPCTSPHNHEIYATFSSLASIASDQDISSQMFEECYVQLSDYTGFSENISDDDSEQFLDKYQPILIFNYDTKDGKKDNADPSRPFSCIMFSIENLTDFSIKDYFVL